jgi:3,4-dihydroxy 2-butanone 4-phosphate synthase / GTP cyclohydrolase II
MSDGRGEEIQLLTAGNIPHPTSYIAHPTSNISMHSLPDILADLRDGKMIVLVDDEERENEGDLVCAAEHVTPGTVNFMLREGRGMLFVALDGAACDRLELSPQATVNTAPRGTAYTVSVDAAARFGVTTGVSTNDRAATIRLLADPKARPADFDRPGHVQPLRARDGGSLVRAGHTEGIVDLCRIADLRPAGVGIEVMNEDGSMARLPDLKKLCERHGLKFCTVADIIQHRLQREQLVQRIATTPFANEFGQWTLIAYSSVVDALPHVVLACGDIGRLDPAGRPVETDTPALVRMHSHNLLGDVLGDLDQPTGQTLRRAMQMIQHAGRGAVVYLRHEMIGRSLLDRLHATRADDRDAVAPVAGAGSASGGGGTSGGGAYGIGSQILRNLGLRKLRLLTNHPFHPTALSGFGLEIVEFVPVEPS